MRNPWVRELVITISYVMIGIPSLVAIIVWALPDPVWTLRIICPLIAVLGLAIYLWVHYRPGKAPDFLQQFSREYFYRDGFAFAFNRFIVNEGNAWLEIGFQNQMAGECQATISLRPARDFFLQRADIAVLRIAIDCPSAAFGIAYLPFAIPQKLLRKLVKFDLGATVIFPNGMGDEMRTRNWNFVADDASFSGELPLAGEIALAIITRKSHKPTCVRFQLPAAGADSVPATERAQVTVLWRLGDNSQQTAARLVANANIPLPGSNSRS